MSVQTPTIKLNNGTEMPIVGFGLWKLDTKTCADQVYSAIKSGYRLLDGACIYENESQCGDGVARAINEGIVKREDLFIVSKLWNNFHDADKVEPITRRQLQDWKIDYFDLFLMHFPISLEYVDPAVQYPPPDGPEFPPGRASVQETWLAMEKLVSAGLTKGIGISNFNGGLILDLLKYANIRPATLQIEHHPYLTQEQLVNWVQGQGIAITAYSSFGPSSYVELDTEDAKHTPLLFEHPAVVQLAEKYAKTPAQIVLRWATQRGIAVIPKSGNTQRLAQNLSVTDFDLSAEDLKSISAMNRNLRFNDPMKFGEPHPIFF
ncbi:putative NAD(P)H-dependent D-xylose reductase xyl1 [Aspergillus steynii IBT 23096]|uniref:D-xylose reductase [NAD(P)H] n=1 Tax=Aspergillus steynii IBT 23096 TaxID=1392250 RepID=A0A2I2GPB9_9EURO|nr:putative NAD(P)H-dependent D-xylose reductase xyl1 [Aspergillus steynii IBT 23096]PLB54721.1 putative NAD(P)H-dependent D-xylose reductase xyl1 [Aspergillus steynii IBT 23096]